MISKVDEIINALRADIVLTGQTMLKGQYIFWQHPSVSPAPAHYITLFEATNNESQSADNEEYADDIEIQIDIWTKGSTTPIAAQVQKIMRGMGFTHQAMPDAYDETTKIYHKTIRFFITQEV